MTRGSQATVDWQAVRGSGKSMILRFDSLRERIRLVSKAIDVARFAQTTEFALMIQGIARDLTPGPRGPSED